MPYSPATTCENCRLPRDEHCQTCWSCNGELVQECCMEGWSELSKDFERRHNMVPTESEAP